MTDRPLPDPVRPLRERLLLEAQNMAEMRVVASVHPDGRVTWSEPYLGELTTLLRDAAAALTATESQGWQPIATAPKDGTRVLLYQPEGRWKSARKERQAFIEIGYWHQPANPSHFGMWCSGVMAPQRPSHWMPLPSPPKEQP